MTTSVDSKNVFDPDPTPKIAPKGQKIPQKATQKSAKEVPNVAELKQKDRAVLQKPKLIVYIGGSPRKFFEPNPNHKNSPEGPKKCRKDPKFGRIKKKNIGMGFKNKKCVLEPGFNPKISPKGPKKIAKDAQNVAD